LVLNERFTFMLRKEGKKIMHVDVQRASLGKVFRLQVTKSDPGPFGRSLVRLALNR
jgi:hypothetical protein